MRAPVRGLQAARLSTRWKFTKCRSRLRPVMRSTLVTVRRPGARIAPISRTCACRQERWTNSGAKARMIPAKRAGRCGMRRLWRGTPPASPIASASSPIRELLSYSDPIGTVYRLVDFDEAFVITNDSFVHAAMGVPRHAFLLAAPAELTAPEEAGLPDADDEEVILLRVTGNVGLPQEEDMQFLRAEAGLELIVDQARERPAGRDELIDALTAERMRAGRRRPSARLRIRPRHCLRLDTAAGAQAVGRQLAANRVVHGR